MRSIFPGQFRPSQDDFKALWEGCIFVVDANVLLNLYRYSPETKRELERALISVKTQLFVPHQAAKEFLKNRLVVTAGQAEEYNKAIKTINDLTAILSNKKKHPFLFDTDLTSFTEQVERLVAKLGEQRTSLLERLTNNDEILEFVQNLSENRTGSAFTESILVNIASEGEKRYQNEIPPGYRDGKKDASGDTYRKFGDLILWKQLIEKAKSESKSVIFITDDKKDDWWLEQSGRTIGPRTELREEFITEVGKDFWMYTVDKFIEETARKSDAIVSKEVIAEVLETSQEVMQEASLNLSMKEWMASVSSVDQYNLNNKNRLNELAKYATSPSIMDKLNISEASRFAELAKYAMAPSIMDKFNISEASRFAEFAKHAMAPSIMDKFNISEASRLAEFAKYATTSSISDLLKNSNESDLDIPTEVTTPSSALAPPKVDE